MKVFRLAWSTAVAVLVFGLSAGVGGASHGSAPFDHGIAPLKGCNSTTPIGSQIECFYTVLNTVDEAHDTITIDSIVDVVQTAGGAVSSGEILDEVEIIASGGATCTGPAATFSGSGTAADPYVGATLCTLPAGSSITTNPHSFYTVQPADYDVTATHRLNDTVTYGWNDLCDGDDPDGCNPDHQTSQAGASTRVVVSPAIDIEKATNGEDADLPTGPFIPVGGTVTWTYVVTNTGDVPLSSVAVTDTDLGAITCPGTTLAVGASMTCTATGTAVAGQYANDSTATGVFSDITVTDSDPSHYFGAAPDLELVKRTNGTDNTCPTVAVGSTVTWTYTVTNTGNVPLTDIDVTDDAGTPANPADDFLAGTIAGPLAPGASATVTATGTATGGTYTNIATAESTYTASATSTTVSDTEADCFFGASPAINVVKLTNGTDNNSPTGPLVPVGSTVTFTYVVTNTGNVSLSGVTVRDDNGTPANPADDFNATFVGGDTNANGLLDLTETWTFTASRIATAGQYANLGTASGTGAGQTVVDTDPDHHFGESAVVESFTPGYWKNHQAHTTSLLPIMLGGYTVDTFAKARAVFGGMNCGNSKPQSAYGCLAGHLLAAKLNLANGGSTCIAAKVADADTLLTGGTVNGVTGPVYTGPTGTYNLSAAQRALVLAIKDALDVYNNNRGC